MADVSSILAQLMASGRPSGSSTKKKKTPGSGRGRKLTPEKLAYMRQRKAEVAAERAAEQERFKTVGRKQLADLNMSASDMHRGKARNAAIKSLYGGDPLSHLLAYQRGPLTRQQLKSKRLNPLLGVQLFANKDEGIRSATRCAAAVEAARRASKRPHQPLQPGSRKAAALARAIAAKNGINSLVYQNFLRKYVEV